MNSNQFPSDGKIRVLVVDDSAIARKIITRALSRDPQIEIVGSAPDPYVARDKILELKPHVITLDIEMPRMDGISFLRILMKHHAMPVVIISSLTQAGSERAFEAMEAGAVEVLGKPINPEVLHDFEIELVQKVKSAAMAKFRSGGSRPAIEATRRLKPEDQVILIGASTGGVEAIKEVLSTLPPHMPPICIVQHIPAYISGRFANRLNDVSALEVREASHGETLERGVALVAPGGNHMVLRKTAGVYRVELEESPPVNYQRPSVDVLFSSAAACAGAAAVAVLLTGMGKDGAEGMRSLKQMGAATIAQDEATSIVYGMPRAAVELGAVDFVLPLDRIAGAVLKCVTR